MPEWITVKSLACLIAAMMLFSLIKCQAVEAQVAQATSDSAQEVEAETDTKVIEVELSDGEKSKGQIYLPDGDEEIGAIVIFVHGTGPGTYLNKRSSGGVDYNYFDLFGDEFARRGIAMFSYNKRGVTIGDTPPMYDEVDREKYQKVLPHIEVNDLATMIQRLRQEERLQNSKVILLGWSEGSILAPMVAENKDNNIHALLLAGYVNDNMYDVIKFQHSGESSMINLRPYFDLDKDGQISKEEYESEEDSVARARKGLLQDVGFKVLDVDKDGSLTVEDFGKRLQFTFQLVLHNTARENDDYIWNSYFRISTAWLKEHFTLEPNKTRLTRLEIPIHIFHGTDDANCPVAGAKDIKARFDSLGKKNLKSHIFKDHNHDLNFRKWRRDGEMSEGIQKMFDLTEELSVTETESSTDR